MTKLTHMKFDIKFNQKRTSVQIPLYLILDYGRYILKIKSKVFSNLSKEQKKLVKEDIQFFLDNYKGLKYVENKTWFINRYLHNKIIGTITENQELIKLSQSNI